MEVYNTMSHTECNVQVKNLPVIGPGCCNVECDYYMDGCGNNCVIYPLDGMSIIRECPKSHTKENYYGNDSITKKN